MKKKVKRTILSTPQVRMFVFLFLTFTGFAMLSQDMHAQPVIVADINPGSGDSQPAYLCDLNGELLFSAYSPTYYRELWKLNDSGVSLAADINVGWTSNPMFLTTFGGVLFFNADNGVSGQELWSYNGASASLVSDIYPGGGMSSPEFLQVYNGSLYFSAKGGSQYGRELWKYDGSSVSVAYDIYSGSGNSSPKYLTVYNGELYFQANHGTYGTELWKYNGTNASIVQDAVPGNGSSSPKYLTVYNGELFFNAYDPVNGYELWKSDGSTMSLVCDINTASGINGYSSPMYLTVYDGALYFSANDGIHGRELWKHNGIETSLVCDINTSYSVHSSPEYLTVYEGELYFSANDETHGGELMKYDGDTVSLVYDIDPAPGQGADPKNLFVHNGKLFFQADDQIHGAELWSYSEITSFLTVSPDTQLLTADADTTNFTIMTNDDWVVSEDEPWLTVAPINGTGEAVITVNYDQNFTTIERQGIIHVTANGGALSADVILTQQTYPIHTINIPQGWSGLSSYILPAENDIVQVFAPVNEDFVMAATMNSVYFPAGSINSIGTWESQSAYRIKVNAPVTLEIVGEEELDKNLTMGAGWNLVPVICNIAVDAESLFASSEMQIVKEVAGPGILWPDFGINTLGQLLPGRAYLTRLNSSGSVTFPPNAKDASKVEVQPVEFPENPWNSFESTASSHVVAISFENSEGFMPADVIGVFSEDGNCYGLLSIEKLNKTSVIIAYADDKLTSRKDGFEDGDVMWFKLYRPLSNMVFDLTFEFDEQLPQKQHFQSEGISAVRNLKISSLRISAILRENINMYPNPAVDMVSFI
nr:hypothetical protein [Bacteroidota bacterium]